MLFFEVTFKVFYTFLFALQLLVWISSVTLFCCLRKYLKPVEIAKEIESEEEQTEKLRVFSPVEMKQ
jgi:hypothetical protein